MPINMNLKPINLPMDIRFGKAPSTKFFKLEDKIKVKLVDGPTMEQLESYVPGYVKATWQENAFEYREKVSQKEKEEAIKMMFLGQTLPSVLETIRFTFIIDGITFQEITHLLRHRQASFSAKCTGDRFMYDEDMLVPEAIINSDEFYERYKKICLEAKQLYVDMVDSKKVSLMDARYILPKCTDNYYYMSINYKDMIGFIKQRIDRAIQPKSDNIIAYQMWIEVCRRLPILSTLDIIDFNAPSWFFIKCARTNHTTNLYFPEENNDRFEYHPDDFTYQCTREELCGTNEDAKSSFMENLQSYIDELNSIKIEYLSERENN